MVNYMNKHILLKQGHAAKKLIRRFAAFSALVVALGASSIVCFASIPEPSEYFYVADYANVLSSSTEENLLSGSEYLDEQCGAQIVVATVNFTDGMEISDYAYKMYNEWEIGDAENNNGLLILLSIGDDNYYVTPGKGLEDKLSSGTIQTILDEYMEPDFAAKNYDNAVIKTYDKLYSQVSDICGASYSNDGNAAGDNFQYYGNGSYNDDYYEDSAGNAFLGFIIILLLAVIIILIIRRIIRASGRRTGSGQNHNGGSYYSNGNIYPPGIHPPGQNVPPQPPPRNTFFFFGGRPRPPRPPKPPRPPRDRGPGAPFGGMGSGPSRPSRPSGGSPFGGVGSSRGGGAGRSSSSRPSSPSRSSRPSGGSRPISGFSGRSHSGGGGSSRGGGAGRK